MVVCENESNDCFAFSTCHFVAPACGGQHDIVLGLRAQRGWHLDALSSGADNGHSSERGADCASSAAGAAPAKSAYDPVQRGLHHRLRRELPGSLHIDAYVHDAYNALL